MQDDDRHNTQTELLREIDTLRNRIQSLEVIESERTRLEHALKDSESLNFALFHYSPIETIVVDMDGNVTGFNLAKEKSGHKLPQIGERMYLDYASHHEVDMHAELMNCIQTGTAKQFPEQQYKNRYLCINISPFPNGAIITSQDISERKFAEIALLQSEMEKDVILDSLTEVVLYINPDHRIISANRAAASSLNISKEDLRGRQCHSVWFGLTEPCDGCIMQTVYHTGKSYQSEMNTPDGKIWSRLGYPVIGESQLPEGLVLVLLDITKRKEAEIEKTKMQEQLLHVQKMEAIGTLAGGVAHDFNNLLTAIRGSTDIAENLIAAEHPALEELAEIEHATIRAGELTRQLLLFSRKHPTKFTYLDSNQIVTSMLKMLHRLIGEDISIHMDLDEELWAVHADAGSLEQIILNLTVNARDAMPEGGHLTIKTDMVHLKESDCQIIPDAYAGDFVRISISDTGSGIPNDIIHRIFEPFFSTKSSQKGTGLGLSVVYGIVKDHKGWINVYTEAGEGTVMKVYLPAVHLLTEQKQSTQQMKKGKQGKGERVLIIEDEKCVREFSIRALTRNNYTVFATSHGEEALQMYKQEKGLFDIVISDVVLPDISGLQVIEMLRRDNPKLKLLLTSGYTDSKSQWSIIKEKKYPFLQKPFSLAELLDAIAEIISSEET